jgi:hypothetical protein
MTCPRLVLGGVLAALTMAALAACGGSSSETPPPLEPDPRGFHYAPALPVATASDTDAGDAPAARATSADDDDQPRPKASPTWGEPSSLPK